MSVATDKDQEFVLCVAASAVRELFGRGNWVEADHAMLDNSNLMFDLGKTEFVRRIDCETDPSRKQVIPYLLLRHDGKFYCYARGKAGGEDRLHAKLSIGIGGHINYDDDCEDLASTIELAGSRELDEEVKLSRRNRAMPVDFAGLISDDSDPVGQVHLGVVLIVDLASPAVSLRDRALTNGHWATTEELSRDRDQLETWSRICMDHAIGEPSMTLENQALHLENERLSTENAGLRAEVERLMAERDKLTEGCIRETWRKPTFWEEEQGVYQSERGYEWQLGAMGDSVRRKDQAIAAVRKAAGLAPAPPGEGGGA